MSKREEQLQAQERVTRRAIEIALAKAKKSFQKASQRATQAHNRAVSDMQVQLDNARAQRDHATKAADTMRAAFENERRRVRDRENELEGVRRVVGALQVSLVYMHDKLRYVTDELEVRRRAQEGHTLTPSEPRDTCNDPNAGSRRG